MNILKFNASGTACDIEKMPVIMQNDLQIAKIDDPGVANDFEQKAAAAGGKSGCYDDCIATIAMTAISTRRGRRP